MAVWSLKNENVIVLDVAEDDSCYKRSKVSENPITVQYNPNISKNVLNSVLAEEVNGFCSC